MAGEEDQHRRRHGEATVVIIGGGISGICVAIDLLKRNNCRDFVILEKSAGVGGTWYVLFKYTYNTFLTYLTYQKQLTFLFIQARQQIPRLLLRRLVRPLLPQFRAKPQLDPRIPRARRNSRLPHRRCSGIQTLSSLPLQHLRHRRHLGHVNQKMARPRLHGCRQQRSRIPPFIHAASRFSRECSWTIEYSKISFCSINSRH